MSCSHSGVMTKAAADPQADIELHASLHGPGRDHQHADQVDALDKAGRPRSHTDRESRMPSFRLAVIALLPPLRPRPHPCRSRASSLEVESAGARTGLRELSATWPTRNRRPPTGRQQRGCRRQERPHGAQALMRMYAPRRCACCWRHLLAGCASFSARWRPGPGTPVGQQRTARPSRPSPLHRARPTSTRCWPRRSRRTARSTSPLLNNNVPCRLAMRNWASPRPSWCRQRGSRILCLQLQPPARATTESRSNAS
jgi:hypothetical protein